MIERLKLITLPSEAALRRFTFPEPEELSPPIIDTEGVALGYGERTVLSRLNLRIDQDDRIALLGKNGEGKSTLAKFLAGRLAPQKGRNTRAPKLRVGYFAQHQVDELYVDETPLEHLKRLRPEEAPAKLRARLGGFGIGADQAGTVVAKLSGGQKARLSLMLATLDAPHLLILDEPTNHLDIESREALVEALTAYTGAVILVSHDLHLLSHVADRLWLVSGGRVVPFDDDLDAYRRLLIEREAPERPQVEAKPKRVSQATLLDLRSEVRKSEQRMEKLHEMRDTLATRLADPAIYEDANRDKLILWQSKFAEVEEAMERAESLWMEAVERFETAQAES